MGGYRFLTRHYRPNCKIYIFGFSRGAFIARFLNTMVEYLGLLDPDNEETVPFIWEAFATWTLGRGQRIERKTAFEFVEIARETLCRPACRVQCLGLFDTVNSIADVEIESSIMPATKVIRHAVSIDERRVKFQPVLFLPSLQRSRTHRSNTQPLHTDSGLLSFSRSVEDVRVHNERYRRHPQGLAPRISLTAPTVAGSVEDLASIWSGQSSPSLVVPDFDPYDDDDGGQDIQEVWFPGGYSDIGGGYRRVKGEPWPLSHNPLVWMVQEAQRAGLIFDDDKMRELACLAEGPQPGADASHDSDTTGIRTFPDVPSNGEESRSVPNSNKKNGHDSTPSLLEAPRSSTEGTLHDRLEWVQGFSFTSVLSWRLMEYLPLGWMDLQDDNTWKLVHWPLHRGGFRTIPVQAEIHTSAIRRMMVDCTYRLGNLMFPGRCGRGVRRAPPEHALGEWVAHTNEGDLGRQTWVQKAALARTF